MQTLKAHGGDARVHIYTDTAVERGRAASTMRGRFYPGETPRYSFYRRLGEFQDQSGHEEVKKNLHTQIWGSNPGRPAWGLLPSVRCELLPQRLKIHVLICAAIRRTTRNLPISVKCRLNYVFSYPMQYILYTVLFIMQTYFQNPQI